MDTPLKFLLFYTVLILFTTYISAQAGLTIFSDNEGMQELIDSASENTSNPLWYLSTIGLMMSLSTEFTLLYLVIVAPFVVGLSYIILEKIIDVIPF